MTNETRSIRAAVLEVLEAVSGRDASDLGDSVPLADMNMDSLSLVAILSLVEARCGTSFDSDATAEIVRASDIGGLVAAVSKAATSARRRI
jgi:acyl carrier protein